MDICMSKGKAIALSDDASSDSPTQSRSRSQESAVPETIPPRLRFRQTARMRTGPYCPMPTVSPIYQTEASGSQPPAHYTLSTGPHPRPPTAIERYTIPLNDSRFRQNRERPPQDKPEAPGSRGLTPEEIKGLCTMSTDLRGVMVRSIENTTRIQELYRDVLHAEIVANRAIRTARKWMWVCLSMMFVLVLLVTIILARAF